MKDVTARRLATLASIKARFPAEPAATRTGRKEAALRQITGPLILASSNSPAGQRSNHRGRS